MNTVEGRVRAKRKIQFPKGLVLLTFMIFIAVVATWIIPAGQYERVVNDAGQTVVVANTYTQVESNPASIWDGCEAILAGLVAGASIAFADLLIGGAFSVVKATGMINGGVSLVVKKFKSRYQIAIIIIMICCSTMCNFIGLSELSMAIIPIMIPVCLSLGLDSLTAMALTALSTCAGFGAAMANPFTVVISQNMVGLKLYSGAWYRLIGLVLIAGAAIWYVLRYAKKIKKNPQSSIMYERDKKLRVEYGVEEGKEIQHVTMNFRQKAAAVTFLAGFVLMIFGCINFGWDLSMIANVLLWSAFISGIVSGLSLNELADHFLQGLKDFVFIAACVGFARGTLVIMENAMIVDTIVNAVANVIQAFPPTLSAFGMLIFQALFNFIVPSGSGQALLTMPIMFPLADVCGVTAQTAILAFQFGDGFTNLLWPTCGSLWGYLALTKVEYTEWVKFVAPLMGIWYGIAAVLVIVAQLIGFA
ncbi:hypothetical protein B5F53_06880 [Blautia sp. An249]|uniref:YfcC family protein n=1 Tax=Blautia sp. An249 TaxID=1965603 RepID=UPI000B3682D4|nr:YfcC family protein [Blautia sp. An249]OUO79671.1 hypothetical protein B5F53_06880 [Blautia sp. An249]